MSEAGQEQPQTPPELEPEPEQPSSETDEVIEPEPSPEPEPEPEQPSSETDAEIEALYTKLETKAKNYVKGMGELLEDKGVPVALCELCADAFPGIRWSEPRDDMHAAMLGVIGAAGGESPLLEDADARMCEKCGGYGAVKLPSHVPGNEMRTCRACNGAGYLEALPGSGTLQAPQPVAENGPVETYAGVPETDPAVVDLRARGFTIIPPMQITASPENA